MARRQCPIEHLPVGQISQRNTNLQILYEFKMENKKLEMWCMYLAVMPTSPSEFRFYVNYPSKIHTAKIEANFLRSLLVGFPVFKLWFFCDHSACVNFQAFARESAWCRGFGAWNFRAENVQNLLIYLFIYLFICLFIYLFIYLFTYLIIHLSICWFTFCCVE